MPRGGDVTKYKHKACEGKGCEGCGGTGKPPVGQKRKVKPQELSGPLAEKRNLCQQVLESAEDPNYKHCDYNHPELACPKCTLLWDFRSVKADGPGNRHWTVEMAQGKAVHHVNHMHDKPLEMNVRFSLVESIRKARKRIAQ